MKKTWIKLFGIGVLIAAAMTIGLYHSNYDGFEDIELNQLLNVAVAVGETLENSTQNDSECVNANNQPGCLWWCTSGSTSCYTSQGACLYGSCD